MKFVAAANEMDAARPVKNYGEQQFRIVVQLDEEVLLPSINCPERPEIVVAEVDLRFDGVRSVRIRQAPTMNVAEEVARAIWNLRFMWPKNERKSTSIVGILTFYIVPTHNGVAAVSPYAMARMQNSVEGMRPTCGKAPVKGTEN